MSPAKMSTGEAAGKVWHHLNENGEVFVTKLPKLVELPRPAVDRALGWLDREGKVVWTKGKGQADIVSLRRDE